MTGIAARRSNAPLALSVVKMTIPGDVERTAFQLRAFDNDSFGFSHDFTWNVMPQALQGVLDPRGVAASISRKHPRIIKCVEALCQLGKDRPIGTKAFADFPESGIRPVSMIEWGPDVHVRVKATCWYLDEFGHAVIPALQPRKMPLLNEALGVYLRLVRQAYCQGEWAMARPELIDLSGDDKDGIEYSILTESDFAPVSDALLSSYVQTYLAAKKMVDSEREKKPRPPKDSGMEDFFDLPK